MNTCTCRQAGPGAAACQPAFCGARGRQERHRPLDCVRRLQPAGQGRWPHQYAAPNHCRTRHRDWLKTRICRHTAAVVVTRRRQHPAAYCSSGVTRRRQHPTAYCSSGVTRRRQHPTAAPDGSTRRPYCSSVVTRRRQHPKAAPDGLLQQCASRWHASTLARVCKGIHAP